MWSVIWPVVQSGSKCGCREPCMGGAAVNDAGGEENPWFVHAKRMHGGVVAIMYLMVRKDLYDVM